ncbi:MAG: ribose-phosphate pyrophosphokinase [Deltaproteobacteria bacterium]|jgi:ribose-phosphate pyrophosphokinase|nr:ribose-phosphate pyrophosphokinase [Deltaproteobacteria bacterium]
MSTDIKLFSGNANPELARKIADRLRTQVGPAKVGRFSDGEINVEIGDNVRGRDVFLIQPTCAPANDHLMELLIMGDACKRASAGRITAVIPYYGYARQDRKARPRVPITAKLVADLLSAAGMDRILTMELHAGQIQGFFDIPVDNLYSNTLLCDTISRTMPTENAVVVSPDAGGVERARSFAKRLGCGLAIIDKRRPGPNEAEIMHIIGDVKGRTAIIVDDMIDTAGTLTKAAAAVQAAGATEVHAAASHAVLSGPASKRIDESVLKSVIVTDSIPHVSPGPKVRAVTVAELFAEAIRAIHHHDSVSRLFD